MTDKPLSIVAPHTELSAEALDGLIESFVLREGTDYGEREFSLAEKVAQVRALLDAGEACIVFDPVSESIDIQTRTARALNAGNDLGMDAPLTRPRR